jgi:hypothetical protein
VPWAAVLTSIQCNLQAVDAWVENLAEMELEEEETAALYEAEGAQQS